MSKKSMNITFVANGEGSMECVGFKTFRCLGRPGEAYPKKSTVDPARNGTKVRAYYSKRYSCPPYDNARQQCSMPYSILINGFSGIYIHEWPTPATVAGNGGVTHGCIHLQKGDAMQVFHWVDRPVLLQIAFPWPV